MTTPLEFTCDIQITDDERVSYEPAKLILSRPSEPITIHIKYSTDMIFPISKTCIKTFHISHDNHGILDLYNNCPYLEMTAVIVKSKAAVQSLQNIARCITYSAIKPNVFYGKNEQPVAKVKTQIFSVFSRQENAFQYFDSLSTSEDVKLFSFESSLSSKRKFLVTDFSEFVTRYDSLPTSNRHVYEVIREGFPCRLYFDLEFNRPANPEVDGIYLTRRWLEAVAWHIFELYGVCISPEHVVDLDSSTTTKFSRHIIILLPSHLKDSQCSTNAPLLPSFGSQEVLFSNNAEVGEFVHSVVGGKLLCNPDISDNDGDGVEVVPRKFGGMRVRPEWKDMWLWTADHTSKVCFVDLGVYSRNRVFRLLLSRKFGKDTPLTVTPASKPTSRKRKPH
mmetsp:Transcript_14927/g.22456  ORF Transcript_14927/g.22456 Transcript_14927/m.22456 type:complete len:392 (-) Transcript_14927:849-2024(-)